MALGLQLDGFEARSLEFNGIVKIKWEAKCRAPTGDVCLVQPNFLAQPKIPEYDPGIENMIFHIDCCWSGERNIFWTEKNIFITCQVIFLALLFSVKASQILEWRKLCSRKWRCYVRKFVFNQKTISIHSFHLIYWIHKQVFSKSPECLSTLVYQTPESAHFIY